MARYRVSSLLSVDYFLTVQHGLNQAFLFPPGVPAHRKDVHQHSDLNEREESVVPARQPVGSAAADHGVVGAGVEDIVADE